MDVGHERGAPSVSTLDLPNHLLIYPFESHYIAQADLEGMIFLSVFPKDCDYRHGPPHPPSPGFLVLCSFVILIILESGSN